MWGLATVSIMMIDKWSGQISFFFGNDTIRFN